MRPGELRDRVLLCLACIVVAILIAAAGPGQ